MVIDGTWHDPRTTPMTEPNFVIADIELHRTEILELSREYASYLESAPFMTSAHKIYEWRVS
jgi:hypothetical protein